MTTIGFIRHGITAWNKEGRSQGSSDIPLDEEGITMAERIAERLVLEEWDIIYTSPLIRAYKTAEIIAHMKPQMELVADLRLREVGGGLTEGTTEQERIKMWGYAWRQTDVGFEPTNEVLRRGLDFLEDIKRRHAGKRVLVVSHGAFIKQLLSELVKEQEQIEGLLNTSLTIIKLGEERNVCQLYNCTAHLNTGLGKKETL